MAQTFKRLVHPGDVPHLAVSLKRYITDAAENYAPIDSPVFSGDPQAPTPAPGDNDTSVATTEFVTAAVAAIRPATWTVGSIPFATSTAALGQNNANLFWDNANVRLGVGLAAPLAKLHVGGIGQQNVYIQNTSGSDYLYLAHNTGSGGIGVEGTTTSLTFQTNNATRAIILANGNFGVGVTAPAAQLHVGADSQQPLVVERANATTKKAAIGFRANGVATWEVGADLNSANAQTFYIFDDVAAQTRFFIDAAGKVGIGTVTPVQTLEVNGAAQIDGSAYVVGTVVSSGASSGVTVNDRVNANYSSFYRTGNLTSLYDNTFGNVLNYTATGRVGIGTTTPQVRLAATGPSGAQAGSGVDGVAQFTTGTGAQFDNKLQFGIVDGSYAWIQAIHPGTGTLNLVINPGGGNVGIGTTGPRQLLEIATGTPAIALTATGGAVDSKTFDWAVTGGQLQGRCVNDAYTTANAWVNVLRSGATPSAVVFGTPLVAVGTGNAVARLTVAGAGQITPAINTGGAITGSLLLDDTTATVNSGGSIIFSANAQSWKMASIEGLATNGGGNTQGHIGFSTRHASTDGTLSLTVQFNDNGACLNSSGSWSTISDASLKSGVTPYARGLDAVLALNPVSFVYTDKCPFADGTIRYGLVAQEVEPHVPEAVGRMAAPPLDKDAVDLLTLDPTHMVYVLINAIKELKAELDEMKGATGR